MRSIDEMASYPEQSEGSKPLKGIYETTSSFLMTFIPLSHAAKPIEAMLSQHGLLPPTKSHASLAGEMFDRKKLCPGTLVQEEGCRLYWNEFLKLFHGAPKLHGMVRSAIIGPSGIEFFPFQSPEVFCALCLDSPYSLYGRRGRIDSLMMAAKNTHDTALCSAFLSMELSEREPEVKALISRARNLCHAGLNTSFSYVFGAANLIDDLIERDNYSPDIAPSLFDQVKRFFKYFGQVNIALDMEFRRLTFKSDDYEAISYEAMRIYPFDFNPDCFRIIDNGRPSLAIDDKIIGGLRSFVEYKGVPRQGCSALFAGVLGPFLDWNGELLRVFHWERPPGESYINQ